MVLRVDVNGKSSANPRCELRAAVRCKPLALKTNEPTHAELNAYWLLITRLM